MAGLADASHRRRDRLLRTQQSRRTTRRSKAFARAFAERHGIPGPAFERFTDAGAAIAYLDVIGGPVVVKADGLAAGKGVIIPEGRTETEQAIREMLSGASMGGAGTAIVLEERMEGEELSLFGISSATQLDPLGGPHRTGPQASGRRRHRAQHRWHGRLRSGPGCRSGAGRRAGRHLPRPSIAGYGRRGHALCRGHLCRHHAHTQGPPPRRVQLPLR
ncbi:MAG: hypothetical protein R2710_31080 [Acidimicrobiales bacterium]